MATLDPSRPVLIEAESSKIGDRMVPPILWKAMQTAPRIVIEPVPGLPISRVRRAPRHPALPPEGPTPGELTMTGDLQTTVIDSMESQATAAIEEGLRSPAAAAADADAAPAADALVWDDATHAPDEAERAAFATAVAAQMGALRQVSITNRTVQGLAEPTITTAFNANGERGTVFGTATFATVPGTVPPVLRLRLLTVELAGVRRTLPATETPGTPAAPAPATEATKP
jgi:hypothetical protein